MQSTPQLSNTINRYINSTGSICNFLQILLRGISEPDCTNWYIVLLRVSQSEIHTKRTGNSVGKQQNSGRCPSVDVISCYVVCNTSYCRQDSCTTFITKAIILQANSTCRLHTCNLSAPCCKLIYANREICIALLNNTIYCTISWIVGVIYFHRTGIVKKKDIGRRFFCHDPFWTNFIHYFQK